MKRLTSFLLVVVLLLSLNTHVFAVGEATPPDKIDSTSVWSYLDDNSDPSGNPSDAEYHRTAWTATVQTEHGRKIVTEHGLSVQTVISANSQA